MVACCIMSFSPSDCCESRSIFSISNSGNDSVECLDRNNANIPCATLKYFIANNGQKDCIIVNILNDQILADLVWQLNLYSDSVFIGSNPISDEPIKIHCEGNSGIAAVSSNRLSFEGLHFRHCSLNITGLPGSPYFIPSYASIVILLSANILFRNCSFYNYSESAIFISHSKNVSIQYSNFTGTENSLTSAIVFWSNTFNFTIEVIGSTFIGNENVVPHDCADSVIDLKKGLGGAIQINGSSIVSLLIEDCSFQYNRAIVGGAVGILYSSTAHVSIRNTEFISNTAACQGGAIAFSRNDISGSSGFLGDLTLDNCQFFNNSAYEGGALSVTMESCSECSKVVEMVCHSTSWSSNSATRSGFAVVLKAPQVGDKQGFPLHLSFSGQNSLTSNSGGESDSFGAVMAENVFIKLNRDSDILIDSTVGTAIFLQNSQMDIDGKVVFLSNSGNLGGAVFIDSKSEVLFSSFCNVSFIDNSASALGGAIYSEATQSCPFEVGDMTNDSSVLFESNTASLSDQSIYLETIGRCDIKDGTLSFFEKFDFADSSETIMLPLEDASIVIESPYKKITLGETFYLRPSALTNALGQPTSGIGYIMLDVKNMNYQLIGPGRIHLDLNYTKMIKYYIRGPKAVADMDFYISVSFEARSSVEVPSYNLKRVKIDFVVEPCRQGQVFNEKDELCQCVEDDNLDCSSSGQNLCLKRHHWYDYDLKKTFTCPVLNCIYSTQNCSNKTDECILSNYCMIEDSDDVCQEGRSGFLCSTCKEDYYFTFAALQCVQQCDNLNTLWLVLALFGYWIILLLAILLVLYLKLSVGSGFMYGLVYFFSVATIFTSSSELYSAEWLQILMHFNTAATLLDPKILGYIPLCFAESWKSPLTHELFRLATPFFMVLAVATIILVSRCHKIPRLLSLPDNSPVRAICLLIFLSYSSISFISLKLLIPMNGGQPIGNDTRVQVAPSVSYFDKNENIPYFVIAICAELFFCLPVCFLFLFAPLLSRRVNLVRLRLKPILDEFQACYKPEYRWFAGFYFMNRQLVYFACMIFTGTFPQKNSILATLNIFILITHGIIQPYSKKWLNRWDTVLLTDIVILSMSSPVKIDYNGKIDQILYGHVIPYTLVFIPILYLLVIILVTLAVKLVGNKGKNCFHKIKNFFTSRHSAENDGYQLTSSPTSTVFNPFPNDQYREPLLAD